MVSLTKAEAESLLNANGWHPGEHPDQDLNPKSSVVIRVDWDGELDRSRGLPEAYIKRAVVLCEGETAVPTEHRFEISEAGLIQAIMKAGEMKP